MEERGVLLPAAALVGPLYSPSKENLAVLLVKIGKTTLKLKVSTK